MSKGRTRKPGQWPLAAAGFTLIELLMVIAILCVVAALLLAGLSKARAEAQSAGCKNRLKQIGLGLQMYVHDNGWYPPLAQRGTTTVCFDRLLPYYPVSWTNVSWNCPTYIGSKGIISRDRVLRNSKGISYSYNDMGIATGWSGCPGSIFREQLGLGHVPIDSKKEPCWRQARCMRLRTPDRKRFIKASPASSRCRPGLLVLIATLVSVKQIRRMGGVTMSCSAMGMWFWCGEVIICIRPGARRNGTATINRIRRHGRPRICGQFSNDDGLPAEVDPVRETYLPRVARSSQPWALGRNPFWILVLRAVSSGRYFVTFHRHPGLTGVRPIAFGL